MPSAKTLSKDSSGFMFTKILIANRGEIACRVMATAKRLGIQTVAVYSQSDAKARHVMLADEAYCLGPPPAQASYLNQEKIIAIARHTKAQAIHPGYGFLSENPHFARAVEQAGLCFIGPSAKTIEQMGLKDAAKALMEKNGIPVVRGYHGGKQQGDFLKAQAQAIGYPVLIKARAGGGGKGMRKVENSAQFAAALASAQREALSSFGDAHVLIEKYISSPRHIEVQIFGDSHGRMVHLFERDCSVQRRHQKVIEEAPAPDMGGAMREAMGNAAIKAAQAIGYCGAGTVEFIADASNGLSPERFYFMEMNTRLQVEHPITECISQQDLVEWQLRVAWGEPLPLTQQQLTIQGWAFEARIYAEDPQKDFLPASGPLTHAQFPSAPVRVESGVRQGDTITPFYDPLIAKLVVHANTRKAALAQMRQALAHTQLVGVRTNLAFLQGIFNHPSFIQGGVDTGFIAHHKQALFSQAAPPKEALALAALSTLGLTQAVDPSSPWSALRNWHGWQPAQHHVSLMHQQQTMAVCLVAKGRKHYHVEYDQQPFSLDLHALTHDAAGLESVVMEIEGRCFQAKSLKHGDTVMVWFDTQSFTFVIPPLLTSEAKDDVASNTIHAPISGMVKMVTVKEKAAVNQGDALIMVEAMKMEHTLNAPRDGVVESLNVAIGSHVQEGDVLLTLGAQKPTTTPNPPHNR